MTPEKMQLIQRMVIDGRFYSSRNDESAQRIFHHLSYHTLLLMFDELVEANVGKPFGSYFVSEDDDNGECTIKYRGWTLTQTEATFVDPDAEEDDYPYFSLILEESIGEQPAEFSQMVACLLPLFQNEFNVVL